MAARQRSPVFVRGRRVQGLFIRTTDDGRDVFEFRGRLNGRVTTRVLTATNKTDANAETERLRADARSRPHAVTVDRRLTVVHLADRWRAAVSADPAYSPRTREDLLGRLDKHILPVLGRSKVCDLDEYTVRRFARGLPAMRAKTHRNVVSVLSTLLGWAVGEGFAETNPVARARERWPRDLRRTDTESFEPRALSDDELAAALTKVGPTYRPVVAFIAATGARVSEALGVRFADVDVRAETWTVAGQLDGDGKVREAKTAGSMATVPLSSAAVRIVKEERRRAMRRGFMAATPDAFMFTGRNGQPLTRRNTLRAWQNATEKVLGQPLRLHDLRTTFASRLAARNVDVPTAQALLRHARPSTTLDVYTRLRGDDAARIDRMRAALDS